MTSGIHSDNARIQTAKPSGNEQSAFIDLRTIIMDFAIEARFYPDSLGHFVLATREDAPTALFLIGIPSARWLGDVRDAGYNVIQTLQAVEGKEK